MYTFVVALLLNHVYMPTIEYTLPGIPPTKIEDSMALANFMYHNFRQDIQSTQKPLT